MVSHAALGSGPRRSILDSLRDSAEPRCVVDLSKLTRLYPNTVRFHLKVLVEAGFVASRPDPSGAAGRPRQVYVATSLGGPDTPAFGYELLAQLLATEYRNAPNVVKRAEAAGRSLAKTLRSQEQNVGPLSFQDTQQRVVALFAELDFEPEIDGETAPARLLLRACPFRSVAAAFPDVVCKIHLGLLRQFIADLKAPMEVTELVPFAQPNVCVALLGELPVVTTK